MLQNPVKKQTKRLFCEKRYKDISLQTRKRGRDEWMWKGMEGEDIAHVNCIHKYFISLSTEAVIKHFFPDPIFFFYSSND